MIVNSGYKIDLHIHSVHSKHKDGDKVDFNSLSNLSVLVDKLNCNEVNICSITDHDAFDYDMYSSLKKEEGKGSIKKVLPGIEFSVQFSTEAGDKTVHIITIFDDRDEGKLLNISKYLTNTIGKPDYDIKNSVFSEEKFISILKKINLDTVMIAHQKNSLTSSKAKKNDAYSLGNKLFNELLFMEYFEAFEFRNKRNDMFNKVYRVEHDLEDTLRFITGSDCHDWNVYPAECIGSIGEFAFTYAKCLPTFKGLVMAITDTRRISLVNSFFNPSANYIEELEIKTDNGNIKIPLSKGINAIIGDNSIGKSLVLHSITNFCKLPPNNPIRKGYAKYLKSNSIDILTKIESSKIFRFDAQGEIRKQFEENKLKGSDFLKDFFPTDIDASIYENMISKELRKLYNAIDKKLMYDKKYNSLSNFTLIDNEVSDKSLNFTHQKLTVKNDNNLDDLIASITSVKSALSQLLEYMKVLDKSDINIIKKFKSKIDLILNKYTTKCEKKRTEMKKMNAFNTALSKFLRKSKKQMSDEQKIAVEFADNFRGVIHDIVDLCKDRLALEGFKFDTPVVRIEPNTNPVDRYIFVSKLNIEEVSIDYLSKLLSRNLKQGKVVDTKTITSEWLSLNMLRFPNTEEEPLNLLKSKIRECVMDDLKPKHSIIENNMDRFQELSSGFNSQIYFSLLSGETKSNGIYIVDQPEDHMSQKAIKTVTLDQFKTMSTHRQVILVTHNPQFIVNLDVDNVIFLTKDDKGLSVKHGALEYECPDYNMISIIVENIEGGLDTVSRRLKRYEKGI